MAPILLDGIWQNVYCIFFPAECGLSRTDLVIILDASTSVTESNFKKQLEFVKTIIEYADIDSGMYRAYTFF